MNQNLSNRLATNLISKFGLPVKVISHSSPDGQSILLEPEGIHPNEGFQVHIQIGWRSLFFDLILGKFAADLLQQMASTSIENRNIFSSVVKQILNEKAALTFKINDVTSDPLLPETWPLKWKTLIFSMRKSAIEINTDDYNLTEQLINEWAERYFACIIALAPLEEIEDNSEILGLPEGSLKKVLVNRYERSIYNRTICLNFHGFNCKVCDLNFKDRYGKIGDNFIHVHHTVPVSQLGPNYNINPIEDLIPVCPNCHSMLHRKNPPFTVNELNKIISSSKKLD